MAIDLKHTGVGRPPLLTDEIADSIYKYMAQGNYISTACVASGIKYDTFLHWESRAKRYDQWLGTTNNIYIDTDLSDLPDNDNSDLVYFQLFHRLKRAEAEGEAAHVANLGKAGAAGPQFWAASATFLERKYPDRWGKRDAIDVNVKESQELMQAVVKALRSPDLKLEDGKTVEA